MLKNANFYDTIKIKYFRYSLIENKKLKLGGLMNG
jgi:hypothetical protein